MLLVGLDAPGPVEIDAGAVQRIDTSVMQLLACLVHDLRQARRDVRWTETSAEFDRAVRQLGMGRLLGRAG
nr:MAG: hypothetical protein DIU62_03460 [Pseudomonadota bacterium]